jgi:hypothetical protein
MCLVFLISKIELKIALPKLKYSSTEEYMLSMQQSPGFHPQHCGVWGED